MSSEPILRARGITKVYGSPLHPLARLRAALLGRDPTGKVHQVLNGVDLDVFHGETVGIMGRNGAGKSTLLGVLGNVIPPTSGSIERSGRIAVLLELGGGFNANLSGIENARLYCRMMGMSPEEIEDRVARIEEFAELGDYFRLPIRTYSSGMYARLGFATAVHVEADLIIVDETLSVGDASFKMKCYAQIERMKDAGMTFLLVSHSQNLIANFCTRAVVLEAGEKHFDGEPLSAVGVYKEIRAELEKKRKPKVVVSSEADARDAKTDAGTEPLVMEDFSYREEKDCEPCSGVIEFQLRALQNVSHPVLAVGIRNTTGIAVCSISTGEAAKALPAMSAGETLAVSVRFSNQLVPGAYFVTAYVAEQVGDVQNVLVLRENVLRFDVVGEKRGAGIVDLGMQVSWQAPAASLETG